MKAADISDADMLRAVISDARARGVVELGACTSTLAASYFPEFPEKVVAAKLAKMNRRGLINGCPCGCRGDWTLTDTGRAVVLPPIPA